MHDISQEDKASLLVIIRIDLIQLDVQDVWNYILEQQTTLKVLNKIMQNKE